ncbi:MAG: acyl-CoA dehydrogenase family protein [Desulfobacter sp.]|jgi:butyryl-CoA dehydrogenase|uniref:acyl-CoA dehydrogenase family protein n=1 Tax=uncultured Desulfobacter sp. TaxID=240139 RepID=UPI0029C67114|nr:acyl-CoA dehydrogenase family protein [uncultured Desulfobacter sp.]MCW8801231.1 acyl-CoA dehydrogenase family protein [Desulfobacter sp.]
MDFNPCMKHQVVRKTVREFAENEIKPHAASLDREGRFPTEIVEKMGPLNYFGLQVPPSLGGAGLDTISYAIVIEELSRVCAALGLCVSVHNSVGLYPILKFGTEEQIARFVPDMAAGKHIGAFCLTEANAGSDAGSVETTATKTDDGYTINGTKIFVTNGGVCDVVLVFAVDPGSQGRSRPNVFIVEKNCPGFSVGEIEDLCGMRANPVSSLFFEDCRIPEINLLGKPGQGLKIGLTALDTGRIGIAAQALGIAQAAFEAALSYAKERRQFNSPLTKFQTIQNYLADMATSIESSRLLLYRAAAAKDKGGDFGAQSAMAKLSCSATARTVTDLAVQIHGGYGYSREYDVERYFREAKVTQIYEGTSEVQKMVIARHLITRPS